ncbi:MAG TPA: tetratricopeptide repeat protein, partial [Steroidobacteraceae bacterium]
ADAARLLEQQIASGQMPPSERTQRTKTLAQLYFRAGNYGKAIQTGNDYLKAAPGDREVQMMVAQGYYQQKSYKNAIAAAERVSRGGEPSEDLLQLVLRSNYELGDKAGTAKALEQLLRYYPTPQTWKSLLKTYFNQAKRDPELLALYRLSQDVGAMEKGTDYIDMAEALIVGGFAAEGQRVLEKGIEAKVFAPEEQTRVDRTLAAAKREAASQTGGLAAAAKAVAAGTSGDDMYEAGKLYFSAGNYAKSAEALRKALAKGGLSDADDANMLLGIALARTNKSGEAVKAFDAVKEPKFAEIARVWKLHAS